MISFLEGEIIFKSLKYVILKVAGVGYKVFLSREALNRIPDILPSLNLVASGLLSESPNSSKVRFFCYLAVRENALDLYGFLNCEEMDLFEVLLGISGIGPKVALEIASLGPLDKLQKEIKEKNEMVFEGIPGIGRKRAQTIILELSGKIREIERSSLKPHDEAEEALIRLGFPRQKAKEALSKVSGDIKDTESRIKQALKLLGK